MDITNKLSKLLLDMDTGGATTTSNVAKNTAKGHVPVIGGNDKRVPISQRVSRIGYQCPKGQTWDAKTRTCVPKKNESVVAAAVTGSGQTRAVGGESGEIVVLKTNKLKSLLGFDKESGAYLPRGEETDEG